MPPSTAGIKKNIANVRVSCADGETINIEYRVSRPEAPKDVAMAHRQESEKVIYAALLVNEVVSWNLTDDDGVLIPVTIEAIAEKVPPDTINDLLDILHADRVPNLRRSEQQ